LDTRLAPEEVWLIADGGVIVSGTDATTCCVGRAFDMEWCMADIDCEGVLLSCWSGEQSDAVMLETDKTLLALAAMGI
jgi:hypothetical protein